MTRIAIQTDGRQRQSRHYFMRDFLYSEMVCSVQNAARERNDASSLQAQAIGSMSGVFARTD